MSTNHDDVERDHERLFAEALSLPESKRLELACRLFESADDDARCASREEWSEAWGTEIERRLAAVDAGEPGIPAASVIAELRKRT